MLHLALVIGFLVAVGAIVGLLARLVTFDRFRLSLPKTIALGTLGAVIAPVVQWWVLTPEARETDSSSWIVAILGAVAAMAIYRAWVPVSAATTGNRTA